MLKFYVVSVVLIDY